MNPRQPAAASIRIAQRRFLRDTPSRRSNLAAGVVAVNFVRGVSRVCRSTLNRCRPGFTYLLSAVSVGLLMLPCIYLFLIQLAEHGW